MYVRLPRGLAVDARKCVLCAGYERAACEARRELSFCVATARLAVMARSHPRWGP